MTYRFSPKGVCSRGMELEIDAEGKVHNLKVDSGCNGNLKGISKLVEGLDIDFVIGRFQGNTCGARPTSCPDQLAKALQAAYEAGQKG